MAQRRSRAPQGRNGTRRRRVYIAGAAGALVVVVALIALSALSRGDDGDPGGGPVVLPSPRSTDIPRDGLVLGNSTAPVSVVEYADFQ